MKVLYFVHDLYDAAVKKRVLMLQAGGADVVLVGFYRSSVAPTHIGSAKVIPLARTYDASFLHRLKSVFYSLLFSSHYMPYTYDADVIICRNLEMLLLGRKVKRKLKTIPLVYESLDIHRLLLGAGRLSNILRFVERWAVKKSNLLITSSPGFVDNYFKKINKLNKPILLLENKFFDTEMSVATTKSMKKRQQDKDSYVIGWFGAIRCRKSLALLSEITRKLKGKVRVVIRGRPAYTEFEDFLDSVEREPYIEFQGEYEFPNDLAEIYSEVDFCWAIDFFEEGGNSEWLLPNRIYEGGVFNSVPIFIKGTEVANKLERLNIGVGCHRDSPNLGLDLFFDAFDDTQYENLAKKSQQVPIACWRVDKPQCEKLVRFLDQLNIDDSDLLDGVYEL
ncbi:glycosyl transferase family 1 [Neptuniibacter pectenicola]|uniref:Glycosyl transferase family 1 n=1 Tax=Neptuniibacter pectenicola TaxID=1806669 RepID=A0ABU9TMJ5_9GAMM